MKVVITGATGFIGTALVEALKARGDELVALSRNAEKAKAALGIEAVTADLETPGSWGEALAGADAIVHLAGESIGGKRWDGRQKQVLRDSRVEATRTIVEQIAALPAERRPKALISASGADYYPFALADSDMDDDEVTEKDPPGDSFLARLCRDWEKEAREAEGLGLRVCCMRTGLVLGPGGALEKMTTPFKLFVGGRIGGGYQWMSWIDRVDAVAAYVAAVHDPRYTGPINLVADSTRNREFSKELGKALGRPSWLPVPAFAVKAAAGELADYLLHGRRVVPTKLRALGFEFQKPTLADALRSPLNR